MSLNIHDTVTRVEKGGKLLADRTREGVIVAINHVDSRAQIRWLTENGELINAKNPKNGRKTWVAIKTLVPCKTGD